MYSNIDGLGITSGNAIKLADDDWMANGFLKSFDQTTIIDKVKEESGNTSDPTELRDHGWLYYPKECVLETDGVAANPCLLHIVLHDCGD